MRGFVKDTSLAIIIPYYKITYFEELLEALSKQTNPNFTVYIGNDSSPDDPSGIIKKYKDRLNITYKKFETNLGGISLTKQWERCLEMIGDETWVWMLPDDDVPSHTVVEAFYEALPKVQTNIIKVFRFPMSIIDKNGDVVEDLDYQDPKIESNIDFYERVVRGKAGASLGDNIFHKKSLLESGGFVELPKAWGSDHATLLRASVGGNICFLDEARLYFRMSGDNISSDISDGVVKMQARVAFSTWLKENEHLFPHTPSDDFYHFFYWKGEYYVLHEWKFSLALLQELYELRKICFGSLNILPLVKVALQKIGIVKP